MPITFRTNTGGAAFNHHSDGTVSTTGGSRYNAPPNARTPAGAPFAHPNVTGGTATLLNTREDVRRREYEARTREAQIEGAVLAEFRILRTGRSDGILNTDDMVRLCDFAHGSVTRTAALRAMLGEPVMTTAAHNALRAHLDGHRDIRDAALTEARRAGRAVSVPETRFPVGYAAVTFSSDASTGTAKLSLEDGREVENLRMRSDGTFEGTLAPGQRVLVDAGVRINPATRVPERALTLSIYAHPWDLAPATSRTLTAAAPGITTASTQPAPGRYAVPGTAEVKLLTPNGRIERTDTRHDFRYDATIKTTSTPGVFSLRLEGMTVRLREESEGHYRGILHKKDGTRLEVALTAQSATMRVILDRKDASGQRSLTDFLGRIDAFGG
ncbi:MAG: hypothetical protein AB2A00_25515 [Myxococcota bacterium]